MSPKVLKLQIVAFWGTRVQDWIDKYFKRLLSFTPVILLASGQFPVSQRFSLNNTLSISKDRICMQCESYGLDVTCVRCAGYCTSINIFLFIILLA